MHYIRYILSQKLEPRPVPIVHGLAEARLEGALLVLLAAVLPTLKTLTSYQNIDAVLASQAPEE